MTRKERDAGTGDAGDTPAPPSTTLRCKGCNDPLDTKSGRAAALFDHMVQRAELQCWEAYDGMLPYYAVTHLDKLNAIRLIRPTIHCRWNYCKRDGVSRILAIDMRGFVVQIAHFRESPLAHAELAKYVRVANRFGVLDLRRLEEDLDAIERAEKTKRTGGRARNDTSAGVQVLKALER